MPLYIKPSITIDCFEFSIYDYGIEKENGRKFLLDFQNSKVSEAWNFYDPVTEVSYKCHNCGSEFRAEPEPRYCINCGKELWEKSDKFFPVASEIADRLKFKGLVPTLKIKIGQKSPDFYLEVKGKQILFKQCGEPRFRVVS